MVARATDAETRADRDDHNAIRLWLRMLATNRLVEGRTRRLLQERYATTLPRFDLMAQLERHREGTDLWAGNPCADVAPQAYTPTAGDCVLIEVRRASGTLVVSLDGHIITSNTTASAATPTVLLWNSVANIRAAYRFD